MGELRKDLYSNRFVLIASERAGRPTDHTMYHPGLTAEKSCPFCDGQEYRCPNEVAAIRPAGSSPNSNGWRVRVFPNKYPALQPNGKPEWMFDRGYQSMENSGVHEVIVETPDHEARLPQLSSAHMADVVTMFRDRCRTLAEDQRWEAVVLFRNSGGLAGASLAHPHSQLLALPAIPRRLLDMVTYGMEQFTLRNHCAFCDLVTRERAAKVRMVYENDDFVVFQPFAPRIPFETLLFPKSHQSKFATMQDEAIPALADALQQSLGKMDRLLNNPPFNLVFHSAPTRGKADHAMHWHVEFMPRLAELGGFEWGSDCMMHPVLPEDAARMLRVA